MNVKKSILFSCLIITMACTTPKEEENLSEYKSEFVGYAKDYMSELKSVLMKNMRAGGPVQAVAVCSDTAVDLTNSFSHKYNVYIKRVSFKNRNSENVPDEFEKEAIMEFEKLHENGKLNSETYFMKKVNNNGEIFLRFSKPIIVEGACLLCHGKESEVSYKVLELLKSKYPDDKAINYEIGDLRGVISISKKL